MWKVAVEWFVPTIVIPALFVAFFLARLAYLAVYA